MADARESVNKASDQFGKTMDKATDKAQGVARQVEEFANKAAEQGRDELRLTSTRFDVSRSLDASIARGQVHVSQCC